MKRREKHIDPRASAQLGLEPHIRLLPGSILQADGVTYLVRADGGLDVIRPLLRDRRPRLYSSRSEQSPFDRRRRIGTAEVSAMTAQAAVPVVRGSMFNLGASMLWISRAALRSIGSDVPALASVIGEADGTPIPPDATPWGALVLVHVDTTAAAVMLPDELTVFREARALVIDDAREIDLDAAAARRS